MDIDLRMKNRIAEFYRIRKSMLLQIFIMFLILNIVLLVVGIVIGSTNGNLVVIMSCAISAFVAGVFLFALLRARYLKA